MESFAFCPKCRHPLALKGEGKHCEGCGAAFYDNVASVAGILPINDRGQVLLARRGREPFKGDYGMIGGFMNAGETPVQAALREAQEETGLTDVRIIELLGIYPDEYGAATHTLNIIYVAEIRSGTPKPNDDVAELEWLGIQNLPERALHGGFRNTQQALADLQIWYARRGSNRG